MKYYEVGFDAGVCYSCNIIQGETEAACRYAAEQHAKQYGYTVGYFEEIAESALKYNRKPVWNADRYQQPETDPEQPETETAEAAQNEEESTMQNNVNMIRTAEAAHIAKCAEYIRNSVHTIGDYRHNWCAQRYTTPAQTRRLLAMQDADEMPAADLTKILDKQAAGIHKNAENAIAEVKALTEYQKPVTLRIFVRWVRNKTWGYNPHVCLTAWNRANDDEIIETKASGCNYDKEAAAVSAALNQCKMILSEIVRATERGEKFSGVHTAEKLGVPFAPDFDLGGMSTLRSIMEQLGYKLTETQKRTRSGYLDYSEYIYNLREEV